MTVYEKIIEYSIEELAEFIYGLVSSTEERMLADVTKQGYNASIVSIAPEKRIESIINDLLEDADDGDT